MAKPQNGMRNREAAGIHRRPPLIHMLLSETGGSGGSYFELKLMLTSAEIICPLTLPPIQSQEGVVWLLRVIVHICQQNWRSECKTQRSGTPCGFPTLPEGHEDHKPVNGLQQGINRAFLSVTDLTLLQHCLCYLKENGPYFRPALWISSEKMSHKRFSVQIIVSIVWKWFGSVVLKGAGHYLSQSTPSSSAQEQKRDNRLSPNLPPQAGKGLLCRPGLPFEACSTASQPSCRRVMRNNVPKPRSRCETCFSLAQTYATKCCNLSCIIS